MELSRRELGKEALRYSTLTILASAGSYLAGDQIVKGSGGYYRFSPDTYFYSLKRIDKVGDVVDTFVSADSSSLMAIYSLFFPKFLDDQGSRALGLVKQEVAARKPTAQSNLHRLDVLPAVTAVHCLAYGCTASEGIRKDCVDEILAGLADPRREVKEILLQNLISATHNNIDWFQNLDILTYSDSMEILQAIKNLVREASENRNLLSPAMFGLEYILNARAVMLNASNRSMIQKETDQYERFLGEIGDGRTDCHWLHRNMVMAFNATYPTMREKGWLPQSSEALMSPRKYVYAEDYLGTLACVRTFLLYRCYQVATGAQAATEAMTKQQAADAVPKLAEFIREFGVERHTSASGLLGNRSASDTGFTNFYRKDYHALVQNPQAFGFAMVNDPLTAEKKRLANVTPFSRFSAVNQVRNYFNPAKSSEDTYGQAFADPREKIENDAHLVGVSGAISFGTVPFLAFGKTLINILKSLSADAVREFEAARAQAINSGDCQGVEEQQKVLGDLKVG